MPHRPDPNFARTNPLAGWIEVFKAGRNTDSAGNTRTWTTSELDEIVRNHSEADAAPAVIGHPKSNDPAYAWTEELKRQGNRLYARFKDWVPEFAKMVEQGAFRKRSVRVMKTGKGWMLGHVGWLGAAPPAVDGLEALGYAKPEGEFHDFEMPDWFTPSLVGRAMRRLREFLIEQFGVETADKVMPSGDIEALNEHADTLRNRETEGDESEAAPSFNRPSADSEEEDMADKDALEKARKEAREEAEAEFAAEKKTLAERAAAAERKARANEFKRQVDEAIDAGRLTPAQAEGMSEFVEAIAGAENETFEFTRGEGEKAETVKKSPGQWFTDFLKSLPKQVDTGEADLGEGPESVGGDGSEFSAGARGATVDQDRMRLHNKALAYQREHGGPEKCDYMTAVRAVEGS